MADWQNGRMLHMRIYNNSLVNFWIYYYLCKQDEAYTYFVISIILVGLWK